MFRYVERDDDYQGLPFSSFLAQYLHMSLPADNVAQSSVGCATARRRVVSGYFIIPETSNSPLCGSSWFCQSLFPTP